MASVSRSDKAEVRHWHDTCGEEKVDRTSGLNAPLIADPSVRCKASNLAVLQGLASDATAVTGLARCGAPCCCWSPSALSRAGSSVSREAEFEGGDEGMLSTFVPQY